MKLSANHLKRYTEIANLFWKYGRSDLAKQMGNLDEINPIALQPEGRDRNSPDQLADDLEAMGPTYVKLGQVLASRPDLLPEPYLKALSRLHDNVKPFSFEEVEQIVTEELGVRISRAFSSFDPEPLAGASLGQVHLAALRDGRPVVVKIQRPNIRPQIAEDFEVLADIASFLDAHTDTGRRYHFVDIVEEFRVSIRHELNYEREARNLIAVGENLKEFDRIQVPQPVADYCTKCVLTMEHIRGRKITSVSPLAQMDLDGAELAETLFKAYLQQVLLDGLFHADPHPGNIFLTEDGHLALLDLGMVGHTTPEMQETLIQLLLAISEGKGDEAADVMIRISKKDEDFQKVEFRSHVSKLLAGNQNQGLQEHNVGTTLMEVTRHAAGNGLRVPVELTLLGKTLLQLDEVGRILDPSFDPNASIRRNVGDILSRRMRKQATQGSIFSSLLDMKEFISGLPSRLNNIMDAITNQELEIKVKAVDAKLVMEGFEKIANRITTGIVLGALIVGACMLMQVESRYRIFGYPSLAILCFLLAATGGFWLVLTILINDRRSRK
ncbi:MAG: AarF/UbiB family protein [Opitutales bacterium]